MTGHPNAEQEKARRFRDAALPYIDDVFALARYLMRNAEDAEDMVQECYLRAFQHFESYRGPAMKPWLLAILRNACYSEFTRRGKREVSLDDPWDNDHTAEQMPIWQGPSTSPDVSLIRAHDDETIRRLIATLPQPFREVIVLREVNDLSYQEIAEVAGVPIGTVMSRLARARSMLRSAWNLAEAPMLETVP